MGKRKGSDQDGDVAMGGDDSDSDMDLVNVDFEMFDPQEAHDFHGLRTLLRQLFADDSALFDLSALTNLILAQPLLGTTVKVDGHESDPYAFLTVVNLNAHAASPAVRTLTAYLRAKAAGAPVLAARLAALLDPASPGHLGLILTERLVNIPTEVVPPMYKMIGEEIAWALEEGEPYEFAGYLVLSKTYTEVASELDVESRPLKKGKKAAGGKGKKKEVFYFHPEDELLRQRAGEELTAEYAFTNEGEASDSKRAFSEFGIKPQGLMMLLEKAQFQPAVEELGKMFEP